MAVRTQKDLSYFEALYKKWGMDGDFVPVLTPSAPTTPMSVSTPISLPATPHPLGFLEVLSRVEVHWAATPADRITLPPTSPVLFGASLPPSPNPLQSLQDEIGQLSSPREPSDSSQSESASEETRSVRKHGRLSNDLRALGTDNIVCTSRRRKEVHRFSDLQAAMMNERRGTNRRMIPVPSEDEGRGSSIDFESVSSSEEEAESESESEESEIPYSSFDRQVAETTVFGTLFPDVENPCSLVVPDLITVNEMTRKHLSAPRPFPRPQTHSSPMPIATAHKDFSHCEGDLRRLLTRLATSNFSIKHWTAAELRAVSRFYNLLTSPSKRGMADELIRLGLAVVDRGRRRGMVYKASSKKTSDDDEEEKQVPAEVEIVEEVISSGIVSLESTNGILVARPLAGRSFEEFQKIRGTLNLSNFTTLQLRRELARYSITEILSVAEMRAHARTLWIMEDEGSVQGVFFWQQVFLPSDHITLFRCECCRTRNVVCDHKRPCSGCDKLGYRCEYLDSSNIPVIPPPLFYSPKYRNGVSYLDVGIEQAEKEFRMRKYSENPICGQSIQHFTREDMLARKLPRNHDVSILKRMILNHPSFKKNAAARETKSAPTTPSQSHHHVDANSRPMTENAEDEEDSEEDNESFHARMDAALARSADVDLDLFDHDNLDPDRDDFSYDGYGFEASFMTGDVYDKTTRQSQFRFAPDEQLSAFMRGNPRQ